MTLKDPSSRPGLPGLNVSHHETSTENILLNRTCSSHAIVVVSALDLVGVPFRCLLKLEQDSNVNGKDRRLCDSV